MFVLDVEDVKVAIIFKDRGWTGIYHTLEENVYHYPYYWHSMPFVYRFLFHMGFLLQKATTLTIFFSIVFFTLFLCFSVYIYITFTQCFVPFLNLIINCVFPLCSTQKTEINEKSDNTFLFLSLSYFLTVSLERQNHTLVILENV